MTTTPTTSSSSSSITFDSFNPIKYLRQSEQAKLNIPTWLRTIQSTILDTDFLELIRNVAEAVSREEEDRIISAQLIKLKQAFSQTDQSREKKRECLIRMIYCHMLGYEVPFGHVQALNMTQDPLMLNKRTGYLTLSLCLPEKHELLIMAVNSILKGLSSTNYLEVCSALTALCKLVDVETIPAFVPKVVALLSNNSTKPLVRKKCVSVLHRFWLLAGADMLEQVQDRLRISLSDKDPSVMAASLCFFLDISARPDTAHTIKDLIPSFVSILKQVAEGRLPGHYIYHGVCHPWLQINLLKLLSNLGANDPKASDQMYQVILFTISLALKYKNNAGLVIVPNSNALESSVKHVSVLLASRHNNLRYLGIKVLTSIVKVAPKCVTQYQLDVIECLESTDETLKRKSLDLLYRMTNSKNIVPICAKLMNHLVSTGDQQLKRELVSKISDLAERYSPNDYWYIETMIRMLNIEGQLVQPPAAYNLIRLIAGGSGQDDNEAEDIKIKQHAVKLCLVAIDSLGPLTQQHTSNTTANELLLKVLAWVLSEYSYLLLGEISIESVINALCDQMDKEYSGEAKSWILGGLGKLTSQVGRLLPQVSIVAKKYIASRSLIAQRKAMELMEMATMPKAMMEEVMPTDSFCEDIDLKLFARHCDVYAKKAVAKGAKTYKPNQIRRTTNNKNNSIIQLVDLPSISPQTTGSSTSQAPKKELNFEYPSPPSSFTMQQQKMYPTQSFFSSPQAQHSSSPPSSQLVEVDAEPMPMPTNMSHEALNQPNTNSPRNQQQLQQHQTEVMPSVPKSAKVVWTKKGFVGQTAPPPQQTQLLQQPNLAAPPVASQPQVSPQQPPTQQPPTTAVVQPERPQRVVDPKKEKMAKELFGGLSNDDEEDDANQSRVSSRLNRAKNKTTHDSPDQSPISSAASLLVNLDLSNMSSKPAPISGSTPPSKKTPSVHYPLLDLESPSPAAKQSPIHSLLMELTPTTSLMDEDHTSADSTNQLATQQQHSPPLPVSTPLATQINAGTSFTMNNLTLTPLLKRYISSTSSNQQQQLYSDHNIVVSIVKQWHNSQLTVLMLISNNQSTKPLKSINNIIVGNDHLKIEFDGDSIVSIKQQKQEQRQQQAVLLSVDELPPKLTVVSIVKVDLKKVGYGIVLSSTIEYRISDNNQQLKLPSLSIPIEITDFLRPHELSKEQFDQLWTSYIQDREIIVDRSLHTRANQLVPYFTRGLSLHMVDSVQQDKDKDEEAYGCSKLVMSAGVNIAAGGIVLFRMCLAPGKISISVKTNDKNFSDVVSRHCYRIHNSTLVSLAATSVATANK
ncbi:hypothetical protein SAMD00019534_071020 [Acytostelium subglobosum LB1]|uniref:hypothetical protein n=1 Tax=Acytostelium subglobosum LB1 TaxID=1410327 RepID=UPI000644A7D3|nr:hypothetical protein SAMD00019534_071020 [Acytostelium subglobosum LB1]GAM23927.1 hypothetical protein SAMD00019534_071020 [Acytostelium subglobosum LB1]|eukprot:XP_012752963.1 hypothetical protein SAMD00019534_071020 [Acytostelium subglobosum LB1]